MDRFMQVRLIKKRTAYFILGCLFVFSLANLRAQELKLRKGVALNNVVLSDSLPGDLALYLPNNYSNFKVNPLLYITGTEDPLQRIRYFQQAAEKRGYIIVASRLPGDSVSLTEEVLHVNQVLENLSQSFPINLNRITVAGFGTGGQLAALLPSVIPQINGVLVLGTVPGLNGLKTSQQFPAMAVMIGRGDFGYSDIQLQEDALRRKKLPLSIFYISSGHERPTEPDLEMGLTSIELLGMREGRLSVDTALVAAAFSNHISAIDKFKDQNDWILAHQWVEQSIQLFEGLWDVDRLNQELKGIERLPAYRSQKRWAALYQYKEQSQRLDFTLNLEEDLEALNFENLGWWNFQMQELKKRKSSSQLEERLFATRMEDFANALVDDYIRLIQKTAPSDLPALLLLNMQKTITNPEDPKAYMQVMSIAVQLDDPGTALYYLEELLKTGYTEFETLYQIPNTGLLRVGPEFNGLIFKYLEKSRYPASTDESATAIFKN